jgi:hypothetical protein
MTQKFSEEKRMGELATFSSILTVLTTPFALAKFAVPDQIPVESLSTTFIAVAPLWKTSYCLNVKLVKTNCQLEKNILPSAHPPFFFSSMNPKVE